MEISKATWYKPRWVADRHTPGRPSLHWHHGNSFFPATTNYWVMNEAEMKQETYRKKTDNQYDIFRLQSWNQGTGDPRSFY